MAKIKKTWIFFDKKMFWGDDSSQYLRSYTTLTALYNLELVIKNGKKMSLQSLGTNVRKPRKFETEDFLIIETKINLKK